MRSERGLLLTLAGIQFTHILDFMIIMPLGPVFVRHFGLSTAQFGWVVSCYTFSAAIASLMAALIVDRFNRRRLLLVLYALFGLATLACGFAPDHLSLLVARSAAGVFGGVLSAMVFTLIGDHIHEAQRGRATGIVMASFSIATIAGVPVGLWLANFLGWHAPFIFIFLLCMVFSVLGARCLPPSAQPTGRDQSWLGPVLEVCRDSMHWRAFIFMSLVMMGGFSVIPFVTLYLTANVRLPEASLPLIYFTGGALTFFTARWFGRLADRYGKRKIFSIIAMISLIPLGVLTHLPPVPIATVLIVTTLFFIFISGRMVPAMALITSVTRYEARGTFMSLISAVQQFASGVASFIAGHLITRTSSGEVLGFGWVGVGAMLMTLFAIYRACQKVCV